MSWNPVHAKIGEKDNSLRVAELFLLLRPNMKTPVLIALVSSLRILMQTVVPEEPLVKDKNPVDKKEENDERYSALTICAPSWLDSSGNWLEHCTSIAEVMGTNPVQA